jgi:hypothetical protein
VGPGDAEETVESWMLSGDRKRCVIVQDLHPIACIFRLEACLSEDSRDGDMLCRWTRRRKTLAGIVLEGASDHSHI